METDTALKPITQYAIERYSPEVMTTRIFFFVSEQFAPFITIIIAAEDVFASVPSDTFPIALTENFSI